MYVFEEREQALRLYAENDQLKIQQLEDRKKIDLLLSLSGITENEVTFFLSEASKKSAIIPQHIHRKKVKKTQSKVEFMKENSQSDYKQEGLATNDVDILKLKVCGDLFVHDLSQSFRLTVLDLVFNHFRFSL